MISGKIAQVEQRIEVLPEDYSQYDLTFKIILIGDPAVGKSSLTNKAIKKQYAEGYAPTVGFDFSNFNVKLGEKVIKLQVWDTCGQEIYRSLVCNFYRSASLAMMVYSIDNRQSYDNINFWLKDVKNQSSPDTKIFLIGNKNDLEDSRAINIKEAEGYAKENQFEMFFETSAKNGYNAEAVFIEAAKILYDDYLKYEEKKKYMIQPIGGDKKKKKGNTKVEEEEDKYAANVKGGKKNNVLIPMPEDKKDKENCKC